MGGPGVSGVDVARAGHESHDSHAALEVRPELVPWARVGAVDAVGLEARVADLGTRSFKRESKLVALDLAIR